MRILLVGVFSKYGSTDVWKLQALRRLGHRVVPHEYRATPVEEQFPRGQPFDLVFVSKGVPLTAAQFAHLATLAPRRLLWWPDPFENWNDELSAALRSCDWMLAATSKRVIERIVERCPEFCIETARILEGCDCEGPQPGWQPPPAAIVPALLHFGQMTERRRAIIERIREAGVGVRVLERPTFGPALQREVLRHAAVLGINSSPDLYSNRVQTVLAMGGVMLQENAPGLLDGDIGPMESKRGPLAIWFEDAEHGIDETLIPWAQEIMSNPSALRTAADAARIFDRFNWQRMMGAAVEFATGGRA